MFHYDIHDFLFLSIQFKFKIKSQYQYQIQSNSLQNLIFKKLGLTIEGM